MKIRSGFVSNSSSASFVILDKLKMTEDEIKTVYDVLKDVNAVITETNRVIQVYEGYSVTRHIRKECILKEYDARDWPSSPEVLIATYGE